MIFKRRRNLADETLDDQDTGTVDDTAEVPADDDTPPVVAEYARVDGPYDVSEVDEPDAEAGQRIDLGCVQIPLLEGLEIRVEVDQESNQPGAVTLIKGEGAVQVRAFAAPRSGGAWAEAYRDVKAQLSHDGGTVDEAEGTFGSELRATVAAQDEQGRTVMQRLRFVGVDGPRWMLQGIMFGAGADPGTGGELEDLYRSVVVVRGDAAMPMGALLPVVLPQQVPEDVDQHQEDATRDQDEW